MKDFWSDPMSRINKVWILLLLCLALYLPGLSMLPATDRDESRYMQATRQMVESGDMIDIRFQDEPRYKKPIGIYWLQAGFVFTAKALGAASTERAPYRLPSAIGATAAVLLLYQGFKSQVGERQAFAASVFLACTLLVGVEAHLAKTDAVQLAAIVAMQSGLANLTCRPPSYGHWWFRLLFWLGLGLGMLIKGPVAPVIAALTIAWISWKARSLFPLKVLHPLPWLALPLLLVGPWLLSIQGISDGQFVQHSLGNDFLAKILEGQEDHGAPPGTYLFLTPLLLWPMSWLIIPHCWRALRDPQPSQMEVTSFAFGWLVLPWILFELVPTKLPHYVLPLLPALCLLAGMSLFRSNQVASDMSGLSLWPLRIAKASWLATGSVLALGVPALSIWATGALSWLSSFISLLCILIIFLVPKIEKNADKMIASAIAAIVVFGLIFEGFLPRIAPLWPAESLRSAVQAKNLPVAISGYGEPSVVFNLGTNTLTTSFDRVVDHVLQNQEAIAIFPYEDLTQFSKMTLGQVKVSQLGRFRGINYSKGRKIDLIVVETSISMPALGTAPDLKF